MLLSAAILAGGRATRFDGRDKSALLVGGRSILEMQIAELSQLTGDILLVGGHAPHARVRAVADTVPGCGPLGGLHAALTQAREDTVIVIACDMPYIAAPLLAYMAGLTGEADAAVPKTARGYHPLCAVYTRRCVEPIGRRLADGRLKMIEMLADVQLRAVTPDELDRFGDHDRLLANLNTPAEYNRLEALQSHELSS
jgi:molybdopterin-guanine dinucleotide biosynthesis protein A